MVIVQKNACLKVPQVSQTHRENDRSVLSSANPTAFVSSNYILRTA